MEEDASGTRSLWTPPVLVKEKIPSSGPLLDPHTGYENETMNRFRVALIGVTALALIPAPPLHLARGERIAREEIDSDRGGLSQEASVRDLHTRDGAVSGEVVNRSGARLHNVELMITYAWLWNDEKHPGDDQPGRTEYLTLHEDVPPRGSVRFTFEPAAPLPHRSDGRFETTVDVVSLEKFPQ